MKIDNLIKDSLNFEEEVPELLNMNLLNQEKENKYVKIAARLIFISAFVLTILGLAVLIKLFPHNILWSLKNNFIFTFLIINGIAFMNFILIILSVLLAFIVGLGGKNYEINSYNL